MVAILCSRYHDLRYERLFVCSKCIWTYTASVFDAHVLHLRCESMFQLFQCYVAISVFMMQFASVFF
jgi:hypothetical protein